MSRLTKLLGGAALALAALAAPGTASAQEAKKTERPDVEVVFCLDTTGSMGGLIGAAKQKIWSICNQIAAGKPTPRLKVGLVAFRDRGDAYVTKIHDLTEDLDAVYTNLMAFQAQGGGDFPESVNQALHESVTKIKWSGAKKTLKIIFLVGDAPPHMDYKDDVKYPETCKLAVTKDIIINTIQCGGHAETKKYWQDICRKAEGSYVQIDERGGPIVAIATPFDADLAKINGKLNARTLVFGDAPTQMKGEKQKAINAALAPGVAADRAAFYAHSARGASYDLLECVKNKTVKLEELKKEQLPPEMQKLTLAEQKVYLEKLDKERTELNAQARDLDKKRSAFIAKKQAEDAKTRARDSFDNQVLRVLQTQARRVNIQYETPAIKDEKK
jgi:Mg-chelatase subunit ChlD